MTLVGGFHVLIEHLAIAIYGSKKTSLYNTHKRKPIPTVVKTEPDLGITISLLGYARNRAAKTQELLCCNPIHGNL